MLTFMASLPLTPADLWPEDERKQCLVAVLLIQKKPRQQKLTSFEIMI